MADKKTLILGLGNDILADDGIGPRLVRDLAQMIYDPGMQFDVASCGGLELMEHMKDYKKVIIIDAIRTREGKPGDVYHFILSDFRETLHLSSLHDLSFITAVNLGNVLKMNLTEDLHIIAVEIVEDLVFSEELTTSLREKYPDILKEVFQTVKVI